MNVVSSFLNANVHSLVELGELESSTETIVVENDSCNDGNYTELIWSRFTSLKSLRVGDYCFSAVKHISIVGLPLLESVRIGMNSFDGYSSDEMALVVKNCSRLRELKIGPSSFSAWHGVQIENMPSLEVIEIGYLHYRSDGFAYASLELKSE